MIIQEPVTTNITRRSEVPAQVVKMDIDHEQRQPFQARHQQEHQLQPFDKKSAEVSLREFEGKDISHFQIFIIDFN